MDELDLSKVTRVEIVDEAGRAFTRWDCSVRSSVQDDGQTLKLFLSGGNYPALENATDFERMRLTVAAYRTHGGRLMEAAYKLYKRFGRDDCDVMDVWGLACIDPTPPSKLEIERAQELAREHGWETQVREQDGECPNCWLPNNHAGPCQK